jgi:DNA-binding CsgD family transcriptional regulator
MSWIDDEIDQLLDNRQSITRRLRALGHHPANFSPHHYLSPHGVRILFLLVDRGLSDREIGDIMGISPDRVHSRRRRR